MDIVSSLFHFLLHMDSYLVMWLKEFGNWTYLILFLIFFCESGIILIPFLPGESLLFALGGLALHHAFSLPLLFILLSTAGILGGFVNISLGYLIGEKFIHPQNQSKLALYIKQAHEFYEKNGAKTIILARFIPVIRTYVPFVAGIVKMNFIHFVIYNTIGAIIWVGGFLTIGYFFGNLPLVKEHLSLFIIIIIIISAIPVVSKIIRYRKNARAKST
ncbi:MAG: VTT domain-containing protein [Gammaproteobacteria bacterium]